MKLNFSGFWLYLFVFFLLFQQKQIINDYKVLNVGITVIFNKVCTALIKYIITCIT